MDRANDLRRLQLEVRFDSDRIEGSLYDIDSSAPSPQRRRFSGWLGLMAAIEAARSARIPSDQGAPSLLTRQEP